MRKGHDGNGNGAGATIPGGITDNGRGASTAAAGPEHLKVLLVDDHFPVLRFLSLAFSSHGCDVTTAGTAEEAFELIAKDSFDLVVSDIKMPGLSGLDVLRTVKGQQPETPVVLITGAPSVDSAVFGLRHQAFDYLTKPFSADAVGPILERVRQDRLRREELRQGSSTLTEELSRGHLGIEGLSHLGALAVQGLDTAAFAAQALDCIVERLEGSAAVLILSDEDGHQTPSAKGDPGLASELMSLGRGVLAETRPADPDECRMLSRPGGALASLAALVPGAGRPLGVLCLGRLRAREFSPDDKDLLVAYARVVAVSLQKILLGENIEQNLVDTISSFVNALESKDGYLKGHSARVSLYAGEIAKSLGLTRSQIAVARRVGILHDLGKIVVMDSILQKPSRLTAEEYTLMKGHPINAAKILKPLRFLAEEAEAIKRHHERYDGKGYPDGLQGDEIPLAARIVTVADSFDAITSNRPYRDAMPLEVAMAEIRRHAGAQFDPAVMEAFARVPAARLAEINRFENTPAPAPEAPLNGLVSAWKRLAEVKG